MPWRRRRPGRSPDINCIAPLFGAPSHRSAIGDAIEDGDVQDDATKKEPSTRGGMKLVYKRLRQLQDDITAEGKADFDQSTLDRANCLASMGNADEMITSATKAQADNKGQIMEDKTVITENLRHWRVSVQEGDESHVDFLKVFQERQVRLVAPLSAYSLYPSIIHLLWVRLLSKASVPY